MNICVFCSANAQIDPDFFTLTTELGEWMAAEGHTLVFGGCAMGLMECIARAVRRGGGRTIGVVPSRIEQNGRTSEHLDVHIPCDTLSDRKDLLLSHADVCVALPGGVGTLDEIFTVVASSTLGYHHKKVILYDMKGFWQPLVAALHDLETRGMIRGRLTDCLLVVDSLKALSEAVGK